jgi:hypothetical protein
MVTRTQIDRLSSRIEALAPRPGTRIAVILVNCGETEAEARARHLRDQPQDRNAAQTFVVTFVDPKKRLAE